jgi:hypothetical protein
MRKSNPRNWQLWPVGESATDALKLVSSKGRVATFGRHYIKKHRPSWIGKEIRAWGICTDVEVKFTA